MDKDNTPIITLPPVSALELRMLQGILGELCDKMKSTPEDDYAVSHYFLMLDKARGMDKAFVNLCDKLDGIRSGVPEVRS